jgi:ferredoxin
MTNDATSTDPPIGDDPYPYLRDDSVVSVQRGPEPGGVKGAYRAFGETLRGLKTTMARVVEGPVTIEYPEEKTPVYPRFRGRHKLHKFEDSDLEKCVGCSLCAAACPADCIRVVAAENDPDNRVSAGERYAATIRYAAADIADTLAEIGPAAPRGRRLPIVLALGAAGLGLAYVVRSKLRGDAAPESFPPPIAQPAAATAARTTARPEPAEHEPVAATASEEPREPKAATPESDAAGD